MGLRCCSRFRLALLDDEIYLQGSPTMQALITTGEADRLILSAIPSPRAISCPLEKATGRVLLEPVVADRDLPPFDRVMMDGIAIRKSDLDRPGRTFTIEMEQPAGAPQSELSDRPGSAIEVSTGSVCPAGADCVVPREEYEETDRAVRVSESYSLSPVDFVHRQGSDRHAGDTIVPSGSRLGPVEIGSAASSGCDVLQVAQHPRIAVVGTGDELVGVSDSPHAHQIRSSNPHALRCALVLSGHPAGIEHHLSDDPVTIREALARLLDESELLIVTGGIWKGSSDHVANVLVELKAERVFHGIQQRPGKPMGLWKTKTARGLVFTLPGNPVSALVCLHRYVLPALDRWCGLAGRLPSRVCLAESVSLKPDLALFLPVMLDEDQCAEPRAVRNSGDYSGLFGSSGFVELPAAGCEFAPGETFPYYSWAGNRTSIDRH